MSDTRPKTILSQFRDWADRFLSPMATLPKPVKEPKEKSPPKTYTAITALEARAIAAISTSRVTYCVGSPDKRFARDINGTTRLTESQRAYLWRVVWRYRRQIADREIVAIAEGMAAK